MIPDLAVLILKIRDYLVWLLPAYAGAILLTAALNLALARHAARPPGAPATPPGPGTPTAWLLARLLGGGQPPGAVLALWAATLSRALTPLALILTAAHDPLLAGLRLALALLLSAGVAALAGRATTPAAGPDPPVGPAPPAGALTWPRALWHEAGHLLDQTAGPLFAAALIGGLFTAWDPARAGVRALAGLGPWAAAPVAALTLLLPLPAGTDLPLVAALTTYNVPLPALLALMGGAPLFHAGRVRAVAARYGRPAAALYLLGGLLLLIGLSMLLGALFGEALLLVL
jgi:hypothetical protein